MIIKAIIFKQNKRDPNYVDYHLAEIAHPRYFNNLVGKLNDENPNWEHSYLTKGQFKKKLKSLFSNQVYINNEVKRCFDEIRIPYGVLSDEGTVYSTH